MSNRPRLPNDDDYDKFNISDSPEDDRFEDFLLKFNHSSPFVDKVQNFYHNVVLQNVGIFLLLLSQFFNSLMIVTCKLLELDPEFDEPIHPLQILFARMSITYACCFLYMWIGKVEGFPFGPRELRKWMVIRGATGFFGVFGLYYSLMYLSVSEAVVITFLVPSTAALAAWAILKERYTLIEAVGGAFSFVGVILIARPAFLFPQNASTEPTSDPTLRLWAVCVGLLGVCGATGAMISIRYIGKRAHPLLTVSYFALMCCVVTFVSILVIPGMSFQVPQTQKQWLLFGLIGFTGFFMQFLLTAGIQREKASRAAAMGYSQMVYAIFWDITVWGKIPSLLSIFGISLIVGSAIVVLVYKPKSEPVQTGVSDPEGLPSNQQIFRLEDFDTE